MLLQPLFTTSSGLSRSIKVPPGTCQLLKEHIEGITVKCGLKVIQYKDNPPHWASSEPSREIDNETVSYLVSQHNEWYATYYERLREWAEKPPSEYEEMTPEFFERIWYGFSPLFIPLHRWSGEYYQEEMQKLLDIMTGTRIGFGDTDPLSKQQAFNVIRLFESILDTNNTCLELVGDELLTSDEYMWCPECGASSSDEVKVDSDNCPICPECHKPFEC